MSAGTRLDAGYHHIAAIQLDPIEYQACDEGSVGLTDILLVTAGGVLVTDCGAIDDPCPSPVR